MSGVCIDVNHSAGTPTPSLLAPFHWARQVAFPNPTVANACRAIQTQGHELALVIAAESFPGGNPSTAVMGAHAAGYRPELWIIGNEMDAGALSAESVSSWTLDPARYAEVWRLCALEILPVQPQAKLIIGGFVAGQPALLGDYLTAVRAVGGTPFGYDVHPYGKGTVEAQQLLAGYRSVAPDLASYVLEWNVPDAEIASYQAMLDTTVAASCYFCWSDGMVDGFGLLDASGNPHPGYDALVEASR